MNVNRSALLLIMLPMTLGFFGLGCKKASRSPYRNIAKVEILISVGMDGKPLKKDRLVTILNPDEIRDIPLLASGDKAASYQCKQEAMIMLHSKTRKVLSFEYNLHRKCWYSRSLLRSYKLTKEGIVFLNKIHQKFLKKAQSKATNKMPKKRHPKTKEKITKRNVEK